MHQPTVFCGIDWASDHHDIAVVGASGSLLARARIDDTAAGFAQLCRYSPNTATTPNNPYR